MMEAAVPLPEGLFRPQKAPAPDVRPHLFAKFTDKRFREGLPRPDMAAGKGVFRPRPLPLHQNPAIPKQNTRRPQATGDAIRP